MNTQKPCLGRPLGLFLAGGLLFGALGCQSETGRELGTGTGAEKGSLTVYSGRGEDLIGPLIERFRKASGIDVKVRYGGSAELAATILEEGRNSQADVFLAQDAGAIGAVADRLSPLPEELLQRVEERFRGRDQTWVGLSGRARVVVYNTDRVSEGELPDSIEGFTDPEWSGRLGWPPTNGSFQAFVTAFRLSKGDDEARQWLEGIRANRPKDYRNNMAIVAAVASGEIDAGFVNHYYLNQYLKEEPSAPVQNHYLKDGDPGALINVSAAGILKSSRNAAAAREFLDFLLDTEAQRYFAEETGEYPLARGVEPKADLVPLSEIETPEVDLSDLGDLKQTLDLLREARVLP
ncbi:iron ABC transporter substrate-binding protein [soil metagenome]